MKFLYAPWRGKYVKEKEIDEKEKQSNCVFCSYTQTTEKDAYHFILARSKNFFIALNLFPYNTGHLLVVPYQHTNALQQLDEPTQQEMMSLLSQSTSILQNALKPDGMNIGLNLGGAAAGGSIPEHLHWHIIPRWHGDTNFLATTAHTKTISINLQELYETLAPLFKEVSANPLPVNKL